MVSLKKLKCRFWVDIFDFLCHNNRISDNDFQGHNEKKHMIGEGKEEL